MNLLMDTSSAAVGKSLNAYRRMIRVLRLTIRSEPLVHARIGNGRRQKKQTEDRKAHVEKGEIGLAAVPNGKRPLRGVFAAIARFGP